MNEKKTECKKCKKDIHKLEVFSNGLCVDCYEKQYNKNLKKTGKMPKPNFKECILK